MKVCDSDNSDKNFATVQHVNPMIREKIDVVKSRVKLDFSLASCGLGLKRAGAGREAGEGLRRRLSGRGNATAMRPQSGGKHWHCHSL